MDNKKIINEKNTKFNSNVGVLDKIIKIFEFLVTDGPADLNSISKNTSISRSTAHRLISAMEGHHLITKTAEGYFIGSRITGWSYASFSKGIAETSRPVLKKLTEITGESSQIYIREGEHRVCIASVTTNFGLTNTVPVGSVFPLHVGSAGRIFILWEEELSNKAYDSIRERGWIESVAEREEGVASVSAPILSNGKIEAAISISGPIARLGENPSQKLSDYVIQAAKEISEKLY